MPGKSGSPHASLQKQNWTHHRDLPRRRGLIFEWIDRFLVPVDDPGSRLFHLNLLMAFGMILLWLGFGMKRGPKSWYRILKRILFRKSYWWNASTRVDYKIYFLNSLFKILLFIPLLDFSFQISMQTLKGLAWAGGPIGVGLAPGFFALLVFAVLAFVWDDGLRFAHHAMMHRLSWLWEIHQTHHSATTLTPVTLFRIHPLESAIATLRNSLSLGVAAGFFMYFFDAEFSLTTFLGVNFFGFVFNLLGANLRHSHIPLSFGFLEYVFISPKQHQIHHSLEERHFDRNFGVSLSVWDQLFGSFVLSRSAVAPLRFGLADVRSDSVLENLERPFVSPELPVVDLQPELSS